MPRREGRGEQGSADVVCRKPEESKEALRLAKLAQDSQRLLSAGKLAVNPLLAYGILHPGFLAGTFMVHRRQPLHEDS